MTSAEETAAVDDEEEDPMVTKIEQDEAETEPEAQRKTNTKSASISKNMYVLVD
jgi:hypothetical protein